MLKTILLRGAEIATLKNFYNSLGDAFKISRKKQFGFGYAKQDIYDTNVSIIQKNIQAILDLNTQFETINAALDTLERLKKENKSLDLQIQNESLSPEERNKAQNLKTKNEQLAVATQDKLNADLKTLKTLGNPEKLFTEKANAILNSMAKLANTTDSASKHKFLMDNMTNMMSAINWARNQLGRGALADQLIELQKQTKSDYEKGRNESYEQGKNGYYDDYAKENWGKHIEQNWGKYGVSFEKHVAEVHARELEEALQKRIKETINTHGMELKSQFTVIFMKEKNEELAKNKQKYSELSPENLKKIQEEYEKAYPIWVRNRIAQEFSDNFKGTPKESLEPDFIKKFTEDFNQTFQDNYKKHCKAKIETYENEMANRVKLDPEDPNLRRELRDPKKPLELFGLIRMSSDPMNSKQLASLTGNKPCYILFNKKVYFVDKGHKPVPLEASYLKLLNSPSSLEEYERLDAERELELLDSQFPREENKRVAANEDHLFNITSVTGHSRFVYPKLEHMKKVIAEIQKISTGKSKEQKLVAETCVGILDSLIKLEKDINRLITGGMTPGAAGQKALGINMLSTLFNTLLNNCESPKAKKLVANEFPGFYAFVQEIGLDIQKLEIKGQIRALNKMRAEIASKQPSENQSEALETPHTSALKIHEQLHAQKGAGTKVLQEREHEPEPPSFSP